MKSYKKDLFKEIEKEMNLIKNKNKEENINLMEIVFLGELPDFNINIPIKFGVSETKTIVL